MSINHKILNVPENITIDELKKEFKKNCSKVSS